MTYGDYPIEIQEIIKQRVEEVGNVYNKSTLAEQSTSNKGFTWSDSLEGDCFWREIFVDQELQKFYQKYPKTQDSKGFTEATKGVKKDYFEVGDTVEVIDIKNWESKTKLGFTFVIRDFGRLRTVEAFNSGKEYAHFNNNQYSINWTPDMLKIVSKGNTKEVEGTIGIVLSSNNKTNKSNGSKSSNQSSSSPIVSGFTINIERGSPVRGEAVTCSKPKITMGN